MKVLVTYASRHGATRGIAARIAARLEHGGLAVTLLPVSEAGDPTAYDAVVLGSAAYMGGWIDDAVAFVRRNRAALASRPVWLLSSGPIGTDRVDAKGRDIVKASEPREFAEFAASIHARDQRVFFGAYDPDAKPVGLVERLGARFTRMPAIRQALPAGDFREWPAIEAWADAIARELKSVQPAAAAAAALG